MMDLWPTVLDSRSCSFSGLQKSDSNFAKTLVDEYVHNLVKAKDKKTLIIWQPYKGNICEVPIYIKAPVKTGFTKYYKLSKRFYFLSAAWIFYPLYPIASE